MRFQDLRGANTIRRTEWPEDDPADTAFRALQVAGEFGEMAETMKKMVRAERGINGSTATLQDVANKMADSIISLDLLVDHLGID